VRVTSATTPARNRSVEQINNHVGFYINKPYQLTPDRPTTIHQWIANEYPDMDTQEINYHILNLAVTMDMSTEQLEKWLLEDGSDDSTGTGSDTGWFLDTPPY
jgi:hypothetical protein